jgi:hypothetical protein
MTMCSLCVRVTGGILWGDGTETIRVCNNRIAYDSTRCPREVETWHPQCAT